MKVDGVIANTQSLHFCFNFITFNVSEKEQVNYGQFISLFSQRFLCLVTLVIITNKKILQCRS